MRYDNLAVSVNGADKHIRKHIAYVDNLLVYQLRNFVCVTLKQRCFAAGENTVCKSVFFDKIFVYLVCDKQVGVDDEIYAHNLFDEFNLVHMLRITQSCDYLGAA